MKKLLLLPLLALLLGAASCEKLANEKCDSLPHNNAPAGLTGGWANGFTSYLQIVDVYTGKIIDPAWSSGRFFQFNPDGKGAEFFYMAKSQFSTIMTKATGTIAFDAGSDASSGSFTFHACSGHYRGFGTTAIDRDATSDELANNLTRKYFYRMEGDWLRISPDEEPDAFAASFRKVK